uniref:Uncharacterized protein n=1 Tax=Macaca nemestrina TaxID=9545 RepID=A0A2K6E5V1_MACNE
MTSPEMEPSGSTRDCVAKSIGGKTRLVPWPQGFLGRGHSEEATVGSAHQSWARRASKQPGMRGWWAWESQGRLLLSENDCPRDPWWASWMPSGPCDSDDTRAAAFEWVQVHGRAWCFSAWPWRKLGGLASGEDRSQDTRQPSKCGGCCSPRQWCQAPGDVSIGAGGDMFTGIYETPA